MTPDAYKKYLDSQQISHNTAQTIEGSIQAREYEEGRKGMAEEGILPSGRSGREMLERMSKTKIRFD
jgi:hypothetical protein